jgi:hypothetical protein
MSKNERLEALQYLLHKTSKKFNNPEILNMPLNLEDRGNNDLDLKQYSMCYPIGNVKLKNLCGPDWTFVSWPSANIKKYSQTRNQIVIHSLIKPIINKVAWAGNIYSPLSDVVEHKTRPKLFEIGKQYSHMFEIRHISPNNGQIHKNDKNYLSFKELLKYKYLLDIGGNGYSGRLKYLMFSRRPLLIVNRQYVEFYHEELEPYVHFIPVEEDLSDLLEKTKWLITHPIESKNIAINMFKFAVNRFKQKKLLEKVNTVFNKNFL